MEQKTMPQKNKNHQWFIYYSLLLFVGGRQVYREESKTRIAHGLIEFLWYGIKKGNNIISRDAPSSELLQVTAANLRLSNHKNGIQGRLIHRSEMEGLNYPFKALVRRFVQLGDNKAEKNEVIFSYWDNVTK